MCHEWNQLAFSGGDAMLLVVDDMAGTLDDLAGIIFRPVIDFAVAAVLVDHMTRRQFGQQQHRHCQDYDVVKFAEIAERVRNQVYGK